MADRNALLMAGSGMLSEPAARLVAQGWRVVLPCRRYHPIPVTDSEATGRAIWTRADWDRPVELAAAVRTALTAPAELLVSWVHESYRRSVLTAVEPMLAAGAPVVEVRPLAELAHGIAEPEPLLGDHPTQQVLFGEVSERDTDRALGRREVVDAVLDAVDRALLGKPSSLHQVGGRRPAHRY
ncbi:hypothetical protein SacmaDRAFT_3531 [Saccharomonospora marina XMU15]|uniref:Uncharacterized protein n=1 Tax=Saccharomonospora marina XMU15 TaxID=882083 RepID=H5WXT8_9PSEU|nr:hypothetical protein [Saccharomonospora marina]EHR51747.1 hypothetical protein SacmaDRAFT_3531 [Saccharomonospora marina XMU15]